MLDMHELINIYTDQKYFFNACCGLTLSTDQQKMINSINENNGTIVLADRAQGKTTAIIIDSLWRAISKEYQQILIVSPSKSAMLSTNFHMRQIIENFPDEIKSQITRNNKTFIEFNNCSMINFAIGSSSNILRGRSLSACYLDDFDLYKNSLDIYQCANACLHTSNGKFVIAANHEEVKSEVFAELWMKSHSGQIKMNPVRILNEELHNG